MRCYFDIETTSKDPYNAEIITGFFLCEDGSFFDMKAQVDNWSYEAVLIHNITQAEMLSHPTKQKAFDDLLDFVQSNNISEFVCYANQQTVHGFMTYDLAVIKMQMFLLYGTHTLFYKYFNDKPISVHAMAKEMARQGYFTPLKGESGRDSFTQVNVYKALFRSDYNSHRAYDDVIALKRIYDELCFLKTNVSNNILK